jgi:hypothetical protein
MNILNGPLTDEPANEIGWALIVSTGTGELKMAADEQVGFFEKLFGKRHYYQVYTGPHRVEFRFKLQSSQSTYRFDAVVTATAQLRDPLSAVRLGLRDTADALRQPVEEALQEAVRSIDFRNTERAWSEGFVALKQLDPPVIRLTEIVLKIEPDEDARKELRAIEGQELRAGAWAAEAQTKKLERDELLDSFGSLDKMLAQLLTQDDPQKRAILKEAIALKMQRQDYLTQMQIDTFKFAVESGHYEDFEIPQGLSNLFKRMERIHGASVPSTRLLGSEDGAEGDEPPTTEGTGADGE